MSGKFVFRARAYAAAHFDWDDMLTSTWPDCTAWLQSEYTGGDDARAYPVTIHGAILGHGESLEEAQPRLANALGSTLPVIALAANAAVADPLAVAAYGADLAEPQPLISYWTPPAARWFPSGKRQINAEATLRLMHAVGRSAEVDLLQRAIEGYRRALGYWFPEQRLLAGEFLSIAAETLTRHMIEARAASKSMTPKNLAQLEGVAGPDELRARYLRVEVFSNDDEALDALHEASNGFEHGYMAFDDARERLEPVLERSMGYVRRALVEASGAPPEVAKALLADD